MKKSWEDIRRYFREGVIVRNPLLVEAAGLFPAVAMCVSLKSALMLSAAVFSSLLVTELLTCLLFKRFPRFLRVGLYMLIGSFITVSLAYLFDMLAPEAASRINVMLPLVAVNSLTVLHCERYAAKCTLTKTFFYSIFSSLGYSAAAILTGLIREAFGSGTFFGLALPGRLTASGLTLPLGGFLVLGFLAAALNMLRKKLYPHYKTEDIYDIKAFSEQEGDE